MSDPSQCGITIVDVEPDAPVGEESVDYRGWEVFYDGSGAYTAVMGDGRWVAYKGGCDLGALEVSSSTWSGVLNEIDAADD